MLVQEEDFVTHTFNRSLLENIDHSIIIEYLDTTISALSSSALSPQMKDSLKCRLQFRSVFLNTVEIASSRSSWMVIRTIWEDLHELLPGIKSSSKLGKSVPNAFSVKIQRRLASTVPPRPIVQVGQEAAYDHFDRLCRDAALAAEVLQYYDSHSLLVGYTHQYVQCMLIRHRLLFLYFSPVNHNHRSTFVRYCSTTFLEI